LRLSTRASTTSPKEKLACIHFAMRPFPPTTRTTPDLLALLCRDWVDAGSPAFPVLMGGKLSTWDADEVPSPHL
jgi:hypothetical protein